MRPTPRLRVVDGALAAAGRQVFIDSSALPPLNFETRADLWETAVIASLSGALVSAGERLRTVVLGVHIQKPLLSLTTRPPELYLLQHVTTTAPNLARLSSLHGQREHGTGTVGANAYYQVPDGNEEWAARQYALWFDPEVMERLTHPLDRGVVVAGPGQSWVVPESRPGQDGGCPPRVSTTALDAVATLRLGTRVGFIANLEGGRVAVRFTDHPRPNGEPVSFREIIFAGWDAEKRRRQPIAAIDVHHNLKSGAGGLWIVISDSWESSAIGALLCFPDALPDDCVRAPSGDALIHPLDEVAR